MTVLEALKNIRTDLGQIPVRIIDSETIGNPLRAAFVSLGAVINVMEAAEEAQKAEAEKAGAEDEQHA